MSPPKKRSSRKKKTKFICHYRTFEEEDGTRYELPMVLVDLEYAGIAFRTPALIDSGATSTFMPLELAEILGFPMGDEDKARGAGGVFPISRCRVNITVLKGIKPIFIFSNCEILVPKIEGDIPYVVLGRDTIFMEFEITFRERKRKIILKSS